MRTDTHEIVTRGSVIGLGAAEKAWEPKFYPLESTQKIGKVGHSLWAVVVRAFNPGTEQGGQPGLRSKFQKVRLLHRETLS